MGLAGFITSVILLIFGILICVWLGWLIVTPLLLILRGKRTSLRTNASLTKLDKIDSLIAAKKYKQAVKKLRRLVIYGAVRNPVVIDTLRAHHQHILSRCLIIADETGSHPDNIKTVEHLFMERSELQALYIKALDSYRMFRMRRKSAGKNIPDWGKKEFEERLQEIKKELKRNENSLKKEAATLFSSLLTIAAKAKITYH